MYPHLGGTENEHMMAQEIHDTWKNQGMDNVEMVSSVTQETHGMWINKRLGKNNVNF